MLLFILKCCWFLLISVHFDVEVFLVLNSPFGLVFLMLKEPELTVPVAIGLSC